MDIICLKWGDKFTHNHVNRLYRMVCKNFKDDFNFICYTENKAQINSNVEVRPLNLNYDLEKWWWKLTLFENLAKTSTMFLDLDVVIQNDITHFKNYCDNNKIRIIKARWKPFAKNSKPEPPIYDMDLNSSILIWKGDLTNVWKSFYEDSDYYTFKYNGIDAYLYFHHRDKLKFLPRKQVYSRLYGFDENHYSKDGKMFEDKTYPICIFNGWRREKRNNKYILDDEGYSGYEKYWN